MDVKWFYANEARAAGVKDVNVTSRRSTGSFSARLAKRRMEECLAEKSAVFHLTIQYLIVNVNTIHVNDRILFKNDLLTLESS